MPDLTCFSVFDGLERMDERELEILCEALANSSTATRARHFFVTGNANCLYTVAQCTDLSLGKIVLDLTYPNREDVVLVTNSYLAGCDIFSGGNSSKELLEYKSSICDRLVQTVYGDYYILASRIRDIRHLSQGEIERVFSRADERRQDTIKYQLSIMAIRLSKQELLQLKDTLHFLAVLDILAAPMPHISVVEQYITRGGVSSVLLLTNRSAYSSLLTIDDQDYPSLATPEITTYLAICKKSEVTSTLPYESQDKQLATIQHFLAATFNPKALETHGFDEDFFHSRYRLSSLSQFTMEIDLIMANVAIRLIDCLAVATTIAKEIDEKEEQMQGLVALARRVLPEFFLRLDMSAVEDDVTIDLGVAAARLLLEKDLLNLFWPVQSLLQVRATWGLDI